MKYLNKSVKTFLRHFWAHLWGQTAPNFAENDAFLKKLLVKTNNSDQGTQQFCGFATNTI